jgi:hypothetical protein
LLRLRLAICGTERSVLSEPARANFGARKAPNPTAHIAWAQMERRLIFIVIPPIDHPAATLPGAGWI